jgi:hypothetical protein
MSRLAAQASSSRFSQPSFVPPSQASVARSSSLNEPSYKRLAKDQEFQLVIRDMAERSGLPEQSLDKLFKRPDGQINMEVYEEFAKTFVPQALDPMNNYEMYEMMGDAGINKATVSYLFRVLHPLLSKKNHPESVSYLNNIKAYYVSTKAYADMFIQIGFLDVFMKLFDSREAANAYLQGENISKKKDKNIYEDIMEAFCGCMELMIDRYVGMFKGFLYVNNFIIDILNNIGIQYDPNFYWTPFQIAKETNDKITAYNSRMNTNLPTFEYGTDDKTGKYAVLAVTKDQYGRPSKSVFENIRSGTSSSGGKLDDDTRNELARLLLNNLEQKKDYRDLIRKLPTAEDLGIESLI